MKKSDVKDILRYCLDHPKSHVRVENVIYAQKLFLVNSILSSLEKKIDNGSFSMDNVDYYLECIVGYMNEFYDLSFVNDKLKIVRRDY